MACTRMRYRELRRQKAVTRYKTARTKVKEIANNKGAMYSMDEVQAAQQKLQKQFPRNACEIRIRRRCFVCGRPRGVMRKFGLCRIHLRELAMQGFVPGLRMASW